MTVREAALTALAEGKVLTGVRLAALTGRDERYCANVLAGLYAQGLTDRQRYRSGKGGKGGHPAWEHRMAANPRPRARCPHCGGEL